MIKHDSNLYHIADHVYNHHTGCYFSSAVTSVVTIISTLPLPTTDVLVA